MEDREGSIGQMQKVIALDPANVTALNYLGYSLAEMGVRLSEAEALIKRALELKPDDGYITDSMGWVYFKMGRHEEALPWIKKALEKLPDDPLINEHLGDTYKALGRWDKALEAYQRALQLGPENRNQVEVKLEEARKQVETTKTR